MSPSDLEVSALRALINLSTTTGGPAEASAALDATGCRAEDFAGRHLGAVFGLVETWVRSGRTPDAVVFRDTLRPTVPNAGRVVLDLFVSPDFHLQPLERLRAVREAGVRRRGAQGLGVAVSLLQRPSAALQEGVSAVAATLEALKSSQPAATVGLESTIPAFCDRLSAIAGGELEPVIPTGIEALDAAIGGHEASILSFIGGLPKVGKGALLAGLHRNLARRGVLSGMVALEDSKEDLLARLVAEESGVPKFILLKRRMNEHQNERVVDAIGRVFAWAPLIRLVEKGDTGMNGAQAAAACRDLARAGCKVITVSNLTRIRRDRAQRDDLAVQDVLTELEAVAAAYRVTIWVDAHLKRRDGLDMTKEAALDDFAFSAAIERMCKVAVLLSRPYYVEGEGDDDVLRVQVAAQMNGKSGFSVDLQFDGPSGVVRNRPAPETRAKVDTLYREGE